MKTECVSSKCLETVKPKKKKVICLPTMKSKDEQNSIYLKIHKKDDRYESIYSL